MYRKSRVLLMIVSLILMSVVSFLFGFTDIGIPKAVYIVSWFLCLKLVDCAAGSIVMER